MKEELIIKAIHDALKNDALNKLLLTKQWINIKQPLDNYLTGHCYVASETLYHLLGGKENGYTPQVSRFEKGTHWWIKDKHGNIFDPTSEQFTNEELKGIYSNGKGNGFLTKNPSKRGKILIKYISIS